MARRKKNLRLKAWSIIILAGVAGFSFYKLLNQAIIDLLLMFGVTNLYAQTGLTLGIVVTALILLGFGVTKAVEKVLN